MPIQLKNQKFQSFLIFLSLVLAGCVVYFVSGRMRGLFYVPMQESLGFNNTQIGDLAGIYGLVSVICYFPGGWLADKISTRILIAFSCLSCGVLTLWFAAYPSYSSCVIIFSALGVCNTLTFWAALLKATRTLGGQGRQGTAFGGLEGARGIVTTVLAAIAVVLFGTMGSAVAGLRVVTIIYGVLCFVAAVLIWLFLEDSPKESTSGGPFSGLLECLKNPNAWLIAFIVLGIYVTSKSIDYLVPYATKIFMISVGLAAIFGTMREWMRPVGAFAGGYLADKLGISKTMIIFTAIMTLVNAVFVFVPGSPNLIVLLVVNTVILYILIGLLRGLYFATLNEGGIPEHLGGTVLGFASAVGFTADIWYPIIAGRWLDKWPDSPYPYQLIYVIATVFSIFSIVMLVIFRKKNAKNIAKIAKENKQTKSIQQ